MAKASDNAFPSILITEGTEPSAPAAGKQRIYIDSTTHKLKATDSGGVDRTIEGAVASGTSFPGSPTDGDLYYRTDLDLLCRYRSSGTRWVTVTLYRESFLINTALQPASVGNTNVGFIPVWEADFALYLETLYASSYVATTNDGTKFWTVHLYKQDTAFSGTSMGNFTTAADSANTITRHKVSIATALVSATNPMLSIGHAKTSTPGNITLGAALSYRLIVT